MKTLIIIGITCINISWNRPEDFSYRSFPSELNDSSIIIHKLDGITTEWPAERFAEDKKTSIQFAFDNDDQQLYLALKIPSTEEQIKMMRMGMNIYLDLKGKHRENMGIEFPMKSTTPPAGYQQSGKPTQQPNEQSSGKKGKPDMQRIKMMFGMNLLGLKLFGFTPDEPAKQDLEVEGSVKIAYSWDSTELMQIEYSVPLKMLDDIVSLNQKSISIGCTVNGMDMPTGGSGGATPPQGGGGGRRSSGRIGGTSSGFSGNRSGRGGSFNQADMEKMMEEQKTWMKYTITIPGGVKGF